MLKIKVFCCNPNTGKIEIEQQEFEKLLQEAYIDGYNDGESKGWIYKTPPTYISATAQKESATPAASTVTDPLRDAWFVDDNTTTARH